MVRSMNGLNRNWRDLPLADRLALLEQLRERSQQARPWCPHSPTEKQRAFLDAMELEVLFGGAGGGGKSVALLMAALQHIDVPGYSALILRRTYADLSKPGGLMARAREWLADSRARAVDGGRAW